MLNNSNSHFDMCLDIRQYIWYIRYRYLIRMSWYSRDRTPNRNVCCTPFELYVCKHFL